MEFFRLYKETNRAIIGDSPQINFLKIEGEFAAYQPLEDIPVIHYIWERPAKVTDIIRVSGPGVSYIINNKAKEAFDTLTLPPHQFIPVTHVAGVDLKDYYYFHCYEKHSEYVDFNSSTFSVYGFNNLIEERKFVSHEEIRQYKENNKSVRVLRIVPNDLYLFGNIPRKYDYFRPYVGTEFFDIVTKTFKSVIEDNNLKGMSFKPCPYLRV